ncbi:hypothetical protein [Sulfurovum sp. TSL1]|uniref:hypothetical protein n=1 Tax=Sulfurovum sp. TSL1 TaxID=2826994 RepID=UPI001CC80717|nr:hypothetical protein [Sulfurovum sp. TSL1]GIT97519.1 hypothetical protein TSL1_03400 [Sulfurovum sp. TSL1]
MSNCHRISDVGMHSHVKRGNEKTQPLYKGYTINHVPISYQVSTDSYGQVRATPLLLANTLNSKMEQWFQNYKFTYLAINQLAESDYSKALQLEYIYSLRTLELRKFSEIYSDVKMEVDLLNYHQLVKIIHEHIELAYKIYISLKECKKGDTILEFEKHIETLCSKFHSKKFPEKLNIITDDLSLSASLDTLSQINKVRNCLEHRAGIVSKRDCEPSKNYMSIKFRYPRIDSPNGEITPSSYIKGRQTTNINFIDETKIFRQGEKISFTFDENTKLIFSLNVCFKSIIDGTYDFFNVNQEKTETILREFKNV